MVIAKDRKVEPKQGVDEGDMLRTLFIMFPRSMTEEELRQNFEVLRCCVVLLNMRRVKMYFYRF